MRPAAITTFAIAAVLLTIRAVHAQEAEIVSTIGREIVESLGRDAGEFGGEAVAKETAKRLVLEATESAGREGGRTAETQVERVVASGKEILVFDLKRISGKSLPLLAVVSDAVLPAAVSTLARPGVEDEIESLGTLALKKAALVGESRLPGAGLRVVEDFGEQGAEIVGGLEEDEANSLVGGSHPREIDALAAPERSGLFTALASRPDAVVRNFGVPTGPLVVVAGGIVLWHGMDLTLRPDERVTTLPDGTVISEKTGLLSRALAVAPAMAHEVRATAIWLAVIACLGCVSVFIVSLLMRSRRSQRPVAVVSGREPPMHS